MSAGPLISASALRSLREAVVLDCSFDLADTGAGRRAYDQGHIPGALYAHLDHDLSGPKNGHNGRHPLPAREAWAATVGRWGIAPGVVVVCYDAQGGPYAARAWWMLRWLGHDAVHVLDGGHKAWVASGGELTTNVPMVTARGPYPATPPAMPTLDADALQARLGQVLLIDARAAARFRGDVEPLDPVAGHIPGASQRFFQDNLASDGCFKSPEVLRDAFEALGCGISDAAVVHQCGSGVTACHNLLAMAHAGMDPGALYPGSWSEWCADPSRPVARG
jgi:thiosulfate/3-mercaptopyruvate sulfurtransferase